MNAEAGEFSNEAHVFSTLLDPCYTKFDGNMTLD